MQTTETQHPAHVFLDYVLGTDDETILDMATFTSLEGKQDYVLRQSNKVGEVCEFWAFEYQGVIYYADHEEAAKENVSLATKPEWATHVLAFEISDFTQEAEEDFVA